MAFHLILSFCNHALCPVPKLFESLYYRLLRFDFPRPLYRPVGKFQVESCTTHVNMLHEHEQYHSAGLVCNF